MKVKGQQIVLCEHHINNLQANNPCESCPVRSNPDKYKKVTLIDIALRDLGILIITTLICIVVMSLAIDDIEICDNPECAIIADE